MIIEISSKNLTISPGSRKLVAAYNLTLKKFFKRIYSIRWSFEAIRSGIESHLRVHAYSGQYLATANGKTIREVLAEACDTVERQRRRRKQIAERARKRTIRKSTNAPRSRSSRKKASTPEDFEL